MIARFVIALHFVSAIAIGSPAFAQADAAVCGGKQTSVRIVGAADGASLRLADGRVVRLVNVIAPLPIDGDKDAVTGATKALGELAAGQEAFLFLASDTEDRYGRIAAHAVLVGGKVWLEAEMLSRGIARVYLPANEKCAKALLQFEAKARTARSGLWDEPKFGVFDSEDVEALLAADGRFVLVEGVIRRVGESRGRLYLDFGRRFKEDFTIIVPDTARKSLVAQGSNPKSWRGKRVRVRGILFSWGGPAIEVNLTQAIELLD